MFYANKIVGWVLSPIGMLFLGCLIGVALRVCGIRTGKLWLRRLGKSLIFFVFALFWFLSCSVATRMIGVPLEGEEVSLNDTLDLDGCDAIVLLGGGMGAHQACGRAEMFMSADRVWEAARRWKANGGGMKLTLSGGDVERSTVPLLKDLGVDEMSLVYFPEARNTEEEARAIAVAGFRRVLLVTSAWHMLRAKTLFERAGIEVVPAPTDYEMHYYAEIPLRINDFIPSANALAVNSFAVKEWVARFCYWLYHTTFHFTTKLSNFAPQQCPLAACKKMFEDSLKALQTDTIDNYLFHSVGNGGFETFKKRYVENGAADWCAELRAQGRIKNLGFSYHGAKEILKGYAKAVPEELRRADHCTGCGRCSPHCPQSIDIPREIAAIDEWIDGLKNQIVAYG